MPISQVKSFPYFGTLLPAISAMYTMLEVSGRLDGKGDVNSSNCVFVAGGTAPL